MAALLAALVAVALLVLVGVAALASIRPPTARGSGAPADEFSAARAFRQVQTIATEPHVAGSAANDRVREHLITTLRAAGLTPEVQDTVSVQGGELSSSAGGTGLARVRNVVARIPGSASTGQIFLVAHYDSVQTGPGGNDDAAGTSTLLEVARALTAGPQMRNDVVLVLTDAEEACLCGAKAFVDQHPLARDGGVALNVEARGSSGPAIMFETSRDNARLIDIYAGAAEPGGHLVRGRGVPVAAQRHRLHPVPRGRVSPASTPPTSTAPPSTTTRPTCRRRWTRTACSTTATTRWPWSARSAAETWRTLRASDDATYFPAPGMLVHYPGWLVWPIAVLALLAVLALGWCREAPRPGERRAPGRGFRLALVPIIAAPALAQVFWTVHEDHPARVRRTAHRSVPSTVVPAGGAGAHRFRGLRLVRPAAAPAQPGGAGHRRRSGGWPCWASCWPRTRRAGRTWPRCPRWPEPSPACSRSSCAVAGVRSSPSPPAARSRCWYCCPR